MGLSFRLSLAVLMASTFAGPRAEGQQLRPWHTVVGLIDSVPGDTQLESRDLVSAQMAVGNPVRALEIATEGSDRLLPGDPLVLVVRASAAFDAGQYRQAAEWYSAGADAAVGTRRAALLARAGDSYERNGSREAALQAYRLAAGADSAAGSWMALASARVAPDSAFSLFLAGAPTSAGQWVERVRAERYVLNDRWRDASAAYRMAGLADSALVAALTGGDTAFAREATFVFLGSRVSGERRAAYEFARERFEARTGAEMIDMASAAMSAGDDARAAGIMETVVESDSSALALRLLGRALERSGRRPGALEAYARASEGSGSDAVFAKYARGRLLLRMRRYGEGVEALRTFASQNPDHRLVPAALGVVVTRLVVQGRLTTADSVTEILDRDWSRYAEASAARMKLAAREVSAGERRWFRAEIAARGSERNRARFLLAESYRDAGESEVADSIVFSLSRSDSLGYYGMQARGLLEHQPPNFDGPQRGDRSARITAVLREFDFLLLAGLNDYADAHLSYWVSNNSLSAAEILGFAEGLVDRNQIPEAVRLGWRAAGKIGLNNIRVIRAIFPWPYRGLIEKEAAEWDVDPFLVAAIIRQESAFDANARSRAGARGLMQLMPPTARWRANQTGRTWQDSYLSVPDANLHIGVGHLADLASRSDNIVYTLAAYNAGGGNLRRWRRRRGMNDPATFIERIPFPETRGYVKAVLRNRYVYRALYGTQ